MYPKNKLLHILVDIQCVEVHARFEGHFPNKHRPDIKYYSKFYVDLYGVKDHFKLQSSWWDVKQVPLEYNWRLEYNGTSVFI
jgi:hypothetical protein